jgi:hypothetical protein
MRRTIVVFAMAIFAVHFSNQAQADAFASLQSLRGKWVARQTDANTTVDVIYDVASKDSVITEHFGKELTVFYRDGNKLLLTHFCNVGNQPRLKLQQGGSPDLLEFKFVDATNLSKPDASHVDHITYRFVNKDQMEGTWTWKKGDRFESEQYLMTRISGH